MAEVNIQFKDDFGCFKEKDEQFLLDDFLDKFKDEIPGLSDSFYLASKDGILVLHTLENHFLSTHYNDELSKSLINILSTISNSSENIPPFELGGSSLSEEFFKNLYEICDDISFSIIVSVVGYPGYYDVTYEITKDGWNVPYCTFYEEDRDGDW